MANEPRRHFDDRYPAAKAAIHLAEFEADIAAADNDQMVRQKIDIHHRRIRQVGRFVYAGHWRHHRPAADINKDPSGMQPLAGDFHCLRRREPGVAAVERDVGGVFEGRGKPVSRRRHNRIHARFHPPHVDADVTPDHHTILRGAPRDPGGIGARYQGLGRGAAGIDASAADEMALNDSHLHPGPGKAERQRWSGLAGADDDRVEVGHDKPLQQQEA